MTAPASVLPWLSGAIIDLLVSDATVSALVADRIAGKTPSDVTTPYITVRTLTNIPLSARGGAWRAVVQVTAWCPSAVEGTDDDPLLVAWGIAVAANAVFAPLERRQRTYRGIYYAALVLQGPTEEEDTSRGPETPMYGCSIQIELTVKIDT